MRFTVVVLPLDPVMPIIGFLVYQLANSISLITKIPISLAFNTKSKSDGTPGESTQRLKKKTIVINNSIDKQFMGIKKKPLKLSSTGRLSKLETIFNLQYLFLHFYHLNYLI